MVECGPWRTSLPKTGKIHQLVVPGNLTLHTAAAFPTKGSFDSFSCKTDRNMSVIGSGLPGYCSSSAAKVGQPPSLGKAAKFGWILGDSLEHTFHLSISSCLDLYCLSNSSKTCLRPSEFVFKAGSTPSTVLSTKTPFVSRKHLRPLGSGTSVSTTSLPHT